MANAGRWVLQDVHYLNVGPGGAYAESGQHASTPEQMDRLFIHLDHTRPARLVLHFHGGLVSEADGFRIAEDLGGVYAQAEAHPVSFIWETGWFEVVRPKLDAVTGSPLFRKLLDYVERHWKQEEERALAKGARMLSLPAHPDIESGIAEEMAGDEDFVRLMQERLESGRRAHLQTLGVTTVTLAAGIVGAAVIRALGRTRDARDHGWVCTAVEEVLRAFYLADIGKWAWDGMKEAARSMWLPNDGLSGAARHVGADFLDRLERLKARRPGLAVDIVAHSAGAVAVCEMLRAARGRRLAFRNVVFLAPACGLDLFREEIVGGSGRYRTFRMFTMRDEDECRDALSALYPRSLLYFISGALEQETDAPVIGLERHIRGSAPYDGDAFRDASAFLADPAAGRLVLSNTAGAAAGFRSGSLRHEDFDDDAMVRESLRYIIGR